MAVLADRRYRADKLRLSIEHKVGRSADYVNVLHDHDENILQPVSSLATVPHTAVSVHSPRHESAERFIEVPSIADRHSPVLDLSASAAEARQVPVADELVSVEDMPVYAHEAPSEYDANVGASSFRLDHGVLSTRSHHDAVSVPQESAERFAEVPLFVKRKRHSSAENRPVYALLEDLKVPSEHVVSGTTGSLRLDSRVLSARSRSLFEEPFSVLDSYYRAGARSPLHFSAPIAKDSTGYALLEDLKVPAVHDTSGLLRLDSGIVSASTPRDSDVDSASSHGGIFHDQESQVASVDIVQDPRSDTSRKNRLPVLDVESVAAGLC